MPNYNSDAGLLLHLQKQAATVDQFKAEAAADAEDIDEIKHDAANMQAIMDFCPLADEYKTNSFGLKFRLIRGEIDEPIGTLMTAPAFTPPFTLVAGIEKRSRERDGRFKRSKSMTEAAMLGLDLVEEQSNISPENVKPSIQVSAAQTDYLFSVTVSGRVGSDMWEVLILRKGAASWQSVKTAVGKSVDVTIQPTTPGEAEQIQVRVQLKKNNQNYGQPSDIVYVTVNP